MVYKAAQALAEALRNSEEYTQYVAVRDAALQKESTRVLYQEYRQLQMRVQADTIAGRRDAGTLERLQRVGEFLQFDADAAPFLLAEYRLNSMLGKVYKLLAEAVEADLSMLEN